MSFFSRLKNTFRPRPLDRDIADEIRDHIERRTGDYLKQGLIPEEANRRAKLDFGNTILIRERSRNIRLSTTLDQTMQDVRYGWRAMRKRPVFLLTAVVSLSLAIGANTAIFSIVDAALIRPLPVRQPADIFTVTWPAIQQPGTPAAVARDTFSYPLYQRFRAAAGQTAELALFNHTGRPDIHVGAGQSGLEHAFVQYVSGNAFGMLGVPPAVGRVITPEDDRTPGAHPIAVLSYRYWGNRFGSDRAVIGRRIDIDGKQFRVVGVAQSGFTGVEPGRFVDIWIPAMMYNPEAFNNAGWHWLRIVGRLAPGVPREQIRARLQPAFHQTIVEMLAHNPVPPSIRSQFEEMAIRVHPAAGGASSFRRDFERPLWIVMAVSLLILAIACMNLAGLLLARSQARAMEMSMRISLGAARGRLIRQLLTESLMLSLLAGACGWLLARFSAPLLLNAVSKDKIQLDLAMNSRMLLFSIAVSFAAALLFGLLPAWHASGVQPMLGLRGLTTLGRKLTTGSALVGAQTAVACCLLTLGAAFVFTLMNLRNVAPGFDPRNVTVLDMRSDTSARDQAAQRGAMLQLQHRLTAEPGIDNVAACSWAILSGNEWTEQIYIPGRPPSEREEIFYRVSPGYFRTMRTPLLYGRDFTPQETDTASPTPAIVDTTFARAYFGTEQAVGRELGRREDKSHMHYRVIGVAAATHYSGLRDTPEPMVYVPLAGDSGFTLYIRSGLNPGSLMKLTDRDSQGILSNPRVEEITTLDTLVGNTIAREKLLAGLAGVFAVLGLILAAIGLFGLLSYSVTRRTREIGIRSALGARRGHIVGLVFRDLTFLLVAGLATGLAASLAILSVLRSLLFGVRAVDGRVIAVSISLFLLTALIAGGFPARRAASIDPTVALRYE